MGPVQGGGTKLLSAITTTLNIPIVNDRKRIYIFLTDGFITDEEAILDEIQNHSSNPTIFTFGAGNNLNRYFLDRAAEVGNGISFEITENEGTGNFVDASWNKIEKAQLTNISFDFNGLQTYDVIKPTSDQLFAGEPYMLYGKYKKGGSFDLTLNAYKEGTPFSLTKKVTGDEHGSINSVVPQIWARQKIRELSLAQGNTHTNKNKIIDVSVEYQVLSKYTAFLAINPIGLDEYEGDPLNYVGIEDELFENENDFVGELSNIKLNLNLTSLHLIFPRGIYLQRIDIFDLRGRLIFTYIHPANNRTSESSPAVWNWDGVLKNGSMMNHGHYIVRISTNKGTESRRIHWNP